MHVVGVPADQTCVSVTLILSAAQCHNSHAAGMIEYWSGTDYTFPQDVVSFKLKLDTDLYALAKAKTSSKSLEISKDGSQFATFSSDRSAQCVLAQKVTGQPFASLTLSGPPTLYCVWRS